jgi:hypothetical protein
MSPALKKVTIELPEDLLEKAQHATGSGITQTVRTGLQLLAASQAYVDLRKARGTYRSSQTLADLKDDR